MEEQWDGKEIEEGDKENSKESQNWARHQHRSVGVVGERNINTKTDKFDREN